MMITFLYWTVWPGCRLVVGVLDGKAAVLSFDNAMSVHAYLSFDLRLSSNSSITVTVETTPPQVRKFRVVYVCTERVLTTGRGVVYYGIGPATDRRQWTTVSRHLDVDVLKVITRPTQRRPSATYAKLRRREFLQHQMDAANGRQSGNPMRGTAGRRQRRVTRESVPVRQTNRLIQIQQDNT